MFAATHPNVDIMAHYLWWDRGIFTDLWKLPDYQNPFADFSVIPASMKNELKSALFVNQVAFELNSWAFNDKTLNPGFIDAYLEWIAELQESGVKIAMGSDSHSRNLSSWCSDLPACGRCCGRL